MKHRTRPNRIAWRRPTAVWLAVVAIVLSLSTSGALAARGGKNRGVAATLTFEDAVDHAIQSDLRGSYSAVIEHGLLTLSPGGKRSIFFDFSTCTPDSPVCESPFGSSTSGSVSNVTMTVFLANHWALFQFKGGLELTAGVTVKTFDDDGDGNIDRYVLDSPGTSASTLVKWWLNGSPRTGPRRDAEFFGHFVMPWSAEVVID